ncbi:MAG TPA: cytochrome P450 [Stenomitos sp.]
MTMFAPRDQQLDPYAFYAERRRTSPIVYDPTQDAWAVYRYDDVKAVLMDFAHFTSEMPRFRSAEGFRESLISTDPPRHRQLRGLVSKAFTPQAISRMAPRIEAVARELLDALEPQHGFDLVEDFAHPLPVVIIAEMLGVPASDRPLYKQWADSLLSGDFETALTEGPAAERRRGVMAEMDAYFRRAIAQRRLDPKDDLISHLLEAELEGERLAEESVLSFCTLLLLAGHVTTVNLITNGMLCLLENPDAQATLLRQPELMPQAIEEMLRYRSPAQWMVRTATEDMLLAGERIRTGQLVFAFIGSANRDEAVFAESERFDVTRHPNPHISFGHGVHFCLGAPLARLEGAIALRLLLDRLPSLHLDLEPGEQLRPLENSLLHGVARLPLRSRPRVAS